MTERIALALIKRLVALGQLDADDVAAICAGLSERDATAVKAAWAMGLAGEDEFRPVLKIVE